MPIRLRLALVFAVATALAAGVGGFFFVTELGGSLRSSLLTSLQVRRDAILQQLPENSGNGAGGLQIQQPGPPAPPGSLASDELVEVLDAHGRVIDGTGPGTSVSLLTSSQRSAALSGPVVAERTVVGHARRFLLLASTAGDGSGSVVVVGASLATVDEATARATAEVVVGSIVGVLVAGLGAWLLASASLRPVERMRRQAARISARDTEARLPVPRSRDEIAALARTLNELLGRLHGALDRQRGFVSSAGHELRTPLATLRAELELAGRSGRSRAELAEAVSRAAADTDRVIKLSDDLLLLARGDEQALALALEPIDLRSLVGATVQGYERAASVAGVHLAVEGPRVLVVEVDPDRFRQVLANLLDNALRHAPAGSTIRVVLRASEATAVLEVEDAGPGFPPAFLPRAFERFSRPEEGRDRTSGGTGLGLAIVKSIVEAHGGDVVAANRPQGGAIVRVTVPAAAAGPSAAPAAERPPG